MGPDIMIKTLEEYIELKIKEEKNAEYLLGIDRGIEQLQSGDGQEHELIEIE